MSNRGFYSIFSMFIIAIVSAMFISSAKIEKENTQELVTSTEMKSVASGTEDEEEVYEPVFEYLKKCPTCNYIQELTALLINEYIKTQDEEAGYGLSELFPPDYISPEDSSNLHHKYNPEFEYVLQLARMIVESEDK